MRAVTNALKVSTEVNQSKVIKSILFKINYHSTTDYVYKLYIADAKDDL